MARTNYPSGEVIGLQCTVCGSHKAITVEDVVARLKSDDWCDCGANSGEVYVYSICETPCSSPSCLCHQK